MRLFKIQIGWQTHLLACLILLLFACGHDSFTPKPRGFPRVKLPEKQYQPFREAYCGFTFDYPTYATIEKDTLFFEDRPPSECWFNIKVPSLNAEIHCSYYDIKSKENFERLRKDAFELAGKHVIKADFIDDQPFRNAQGVGGFTFDIQGPAACPFQFYLTDSTRHFLRGALYFNAAARPDSLAPVLNFMKQDLERMLGSFQWAGKK
jgi:gliding motility-associated lipoprotein GldD